MNLSTFLWGMLEIPVPTSWRAASVGFFFSSLSLWSCMCLELWSVILGGLQAHNLSSCKPSLRRKDWVWLFNMLFVGVLGRVGSSSRMGSKPGTLYSTPRVVFFLLCHLYPFDHVLSPLLYHYATVDSYTFNALFCVWMIKLCDR